MKYKIITDSNFFQNYDKIGINFNFLGSFYDINNKTIYLLELNEYDFNILEGQINSWDINIGNWYWDNGLGYQGDNYFSIILNDKQVKLYYEEYLLLDYINLEIFATDYCKDNYWPFNTTDDDYKKYKENYLKKYIENNSPFSTFSEYCFKIFKVSSLENIGKLLFANAKLNNILPEELLKLFKD